MLTRPGRLPDRHPPLPSGQSLNPATTSHHARLCFTRHQQGFNHVHPSGLPLARAPGVEPAALRLSPELRTPPSPAAHVRAGTGHRARTWNNAQRHQPNLRSSSSLNACDLASHGEQQVRGDALVETRFRTGITKVIPWLAVSGRGHIVVPVDVTGSSRNGPRVGRRRTGQGLSGVSFCLCRASDQAIDAAPSRFVHLRTLVGPHRGDCSIGDAALRLERHRQGVHRRIASPSERRAGGDKHSAQTRCCQGHPRGPKNASCCACTPLMIAPGGSFHCCRSPPHAAIGPDVDWVADRYSPRP